MGKSVYPACITFCAEVAMTVDVSQNKNNLNNIFHFPSGALNWHSDSFLRDSINLQRRYFKHNCQPLNRKPEGAPTILQLTIGVWGAVEPKRRLRGSIEWSITGKSICCD